MPTFRQPRPVTLILLVLAAGLLGHGLAYVGPAPIAVPPDAVLPDGGRYTGDTKAGRFHGEGVLTWPDGSRYAGDFVDGLFEGAGRYVHADGAVYEGQFEAGQFHGQGTYTTAAGAVHAGRWVDDELVEGRYRDGNGNRYVGAFADWQFHGEGVYTTADGHEYRGTFRNGKLHGEGVHEAPSGLRYRGEFRNGRYHGQGRLTEANGDRYIGEFRDGYRHGEGRLLRADADEAISGEWVWGEYQGTEAAAAERRATVESALYSQPALLERALGAVRAGELGRIELYFVGFSPFGGQDVFRREIDAVAERMAERFDAGERTVVLGNHPDTVDTRPLATRTSLERTLAHVGEKMNADEDILFLYLTSHGSRDHALAVEQPGMELPDLGAEALGRMLGDIDQRWQVVGVSACYAGGFIGPLQGPDTLVMTAARADRTSFGCGDDSDMTYFGRALFDEALPAADSFRSAFARARELVRRWETDQGIERHSEPQIAMGDALAGHLERWRDQRATAGR